MLMAVPMSIMSLLMRMPVMMLMLQLLLVKLLFAGRFEPSLVHLHIYGVCRTASVALPNMLLVESDSVQWLPWQFLQQAAIQGAGGQCLTWQ